MTDGNNIQQLLSSITSSVDQDFQDFEPVKRLSGTFNTKPSTIILPLIIVILIISVLTVNLARFVITVFGMIYPSYMSFKAINGKNQQLCKKWLTYWIVFAFVTVFDGLLSTILFFLPAFYAFKLLFIIWLFYPRTDGASMIYERFLRPYLHQVKATLKNISAK